MGAATEADIRKVLESVTLTAQQRDALQIKCDSMEKSITMLQQENDDLHQLNTSLQGRLDSCQIRNGELQGTFDSLHSIIDIAKKKGWRDKGVHLTPHDLDEKISPADDRRPIPKFLADQR